MTLHKTYQTNFIFCTKKEMERSIFHTFNLLSEFNCPSCNARCEHPNCHTSIETGHFSNDGILIGEILFHKGPYVPIQQVFGQVLNSRTKHYSCFSYFLPTYLYRPPLLFRLISLSHYSAGSISVTAPFRRKRWKDKATLFDSLYTPIHHHCTRGWGRFTGLLMTFLSTLTRTTYQSTKADSCSSPHLHLSSCLEQDVMSCSGSWSHVQNWEPHNVTVDFEETVYNWETSFQTQIVFSLFLSQLKKGHIRPKFWDPREKVQKKNLGKSSPISSCRQPAIRSSHLPPQNER